MNQVMLIGRITRDPEVRYGSESQKAWCKLTVAIDRGKDKQGNDMGADFPTVYCFGKTAENCERFLKKGLLVGVIGRLRTGKYDKEGKTIYTTDVYAERIEFLQWADEKKPAESGSTPTGFQQLTDDDIPF